jgi:hypothetical protein
MSLTEQKQLLEAIGQLSDRDIPLVLQFISSLQTNNQPKSAQTVLERMGGCPKHFLEGSGNLSDRNVRKKIIADKIRTKHQARHE